MGWLPKHYIALIVGLLLFLFIYYFRNDWKTEIISIVIINEEDSSKDTLRNVTINRKILNLNVSHVIYPKSCGNSTFAILIVTSYAGDVETRSYARRAYSNDILEKLNFRRIFLLALLNNAPDQISQDAILDEQSRYQDILQGDFLENYRNLTYKHLMGLRWASIHCNSARFILKMDHDIAYDLFQVNNFLRKLPKRELTLAGYVMSNLKPIRDPRSKWYVTINEYTNHYYPDFLSGWFYITNPKTALLLLRESFSINYFWIDDAFVTGVLREKVGLPLVKLNRYYTTQTRHLECCVNGSQSLCDFWFGPTGGDNSILIKFADLSKHCLSSFCPSRSLNAIRNKC